MKAITQARITNAATHTVSIFSILFCAVMLLMALSTLAFAAPAQAPGLPTMSGGVGVSTAGFGSVQSGAGLEAVSSTGGALNEAQDNE